MVNFLGSVDEMALPWYVSTPTAVFLGLIADVLSNLLLDLNESLLLTLFFL